MKRNSVLSTLTRFLSGGLVRPYTAAILAQNNIKKVEVLEYAELGMVGKMQVDPEA